VLDEACDRIRGFDPLFLVVALGFDTMRGDPTGSFDLTASGMRAVGRAVAGLDVPTVVVQEGGYSIRNLRAGSIAFFRGVVDRIR
jgi:acetoin utilization deacetylase AcuC-like enzyme